MAYLLPLPALDRAAEAKIRKMCTVRRKKGFSGAQPPPILAIDVRADGVRLPLATWRSFCDEFPNDAPFEPHAIPFRGELREHQVPVVEEALATLEAEGSVFLSLPTASGKTVLAIYLAARLGLKTLILCHLDVIKGQWADKFGEFAGVDLSASDAVEIQGVIRASTLDDEYLAQFGTIVLDEAHIVTKTAFMDVLMRARPRYLVGLSATPDRADGLDRLLALFFPAPFIVRAPQKALTIVKLQTPFVPDVEYHEVKGRVVPNWNVMLRSLAHNEARQGFIADLVEARLADPKEKLLVLCTRVAMAEGLVAALEAREADVEILIGRKKKWRRDARCLVAGTLKAGVGFDDGDLTTLILASSVKDVRQFEGRLRAVNGTVVDIVDRHPLFEKHWELRRRWYRKLKSTIQGEAPKPKKAAAPRARAVRANVASAAPRARAVRANVASAS